MGKGCLPGIPAPFTWEFIFTQFSSSCYCYFLGVTHLRWGELLQTVTQVCQILIVTHALSDMVSSLETEGNQVTHILCGDFNIEPQFPAYQLLKEGRLTDKEMRTLGGVDYIRWSPDMEAPSQVKLS